MTGEHVLQASGSAPSELIDNLLAACRSGQFEPGQKAVDKIVKGGYPAAQVRFQCTYRITALLICCSDVCSECFLLACLR